jgi:hypothetical protein
VLIPAPALAEAGRAAVGEPVSLHMLTGGELAEAVKWLAIVAARETRSI